MMNKEEAKKFLADKEHALRCALPYAKSGWFEETMKEIQALGVAIESLSQPERPKGRWVGIQSEKFIGYDEWGGPMYRLCSYYTCRKCGRKTVVKTNFCPNCGADMRDHIPEATKKVEDGEEEC